MTPPRKTQPTISEPKEAGSAITKVLSLRISQHIADWITGEARKHNWSSNETYGRVIEQVMTYFGVPVTMARDLEADRLKLGLEVRDYYAHVLVRRYQEIQEKGPGFDGERKK